MPILPGAVIGVLGSGQLGRMLALAARAMGYRIHTYSPDQDSPTGQAADQEFIAAYADVDSLKRFIGGVDVLTFEFENVDVAVADVAEEMGVPVRPGGWVLETAQQRIVEKTFLRGAGLPVADFASITDEAGLTAAASAIGFPAVLKSATFGYDGKGQALVRDIAELGAAWSALGQQAAILEAYVDFVAELSVVAARNPAGQFAHYGAIENIHRDHILDLSIAPARVLAALAAEAVEMTRAVMHALDAVGVLCVEFFLTARDDLLINEIAPRPHNSGHLTIEAAFASQFEQQLRAVCALPLADTQPVRPAAMANLLGDVWAKGEPHWAAALQSPHVKLHLYGKRAARSGRKMGHLTALGPDVETALATVTRARSALSDPERT